MLPKFRRSKSTQTLSDQSPMSALLRRFAAKDEAETEPTTLSGHKPIIAASKGLKYEYFSILEDFLKLIPHAKKGSSVPPNEVKFLDEIATDRHCDTVAFFESRHRGDNRECYFWISRVPEGPSYNFYLDGPVSINSLRTIGNCLKGSRPLLFFDPLFDGNDHLKMAKAMLNRLFSVPYQNKHSKPFVDRAMSFFIEENETITIRHYQIQWEDDGSQRLVEVGPRVSLIPNFVLAGAFKGSKIWKNGTFVSPYKVNKEIRREKAIEKMKMRDRQAVKEEKKQKIPEIKDPMKGLFDEANEDVKQESGEEE